jgi:hypothetical protein
MTNEIQTLIDNAEKWLSERTEICASRYCHPELLAEYALIERAVDSVKSNKDGLYTVSQSFGILKILQETQS